MKRLVVFVAVCALAAVLPLSAGAAIKFTKVYYDSPGTDTGSNRSLNGEWVRIKNTGSTARQLQGWTIRDKSSHVYRFGSFRLGAGNSVTLHTGNGSNTATHRYWRSSSYVWNNTGDRAILKNSGGTRIDTCSWGSSGDYTVCAFLVRPNVVIIETDDQNLESLRVMANVGTLLAAQGTTFKNSVASYPFCCPSRASLLTGQYAHNHGVQSNHAPSGGYSKLDHANALPVWLTRAGYYTAFVGKYLNQYGNEDPYERPPGYNEWYAAVGGSSLVYYNYRLNENGRIVAYGADPASYQTDVYARRAVDVIRRRAPQTRPFFLWLSVLAPHRDWNKSSAVPAPRHLNRFASAPLPRPPSFNEADVSDKPARIRTLALLTETQIGSLTQRYRRYLESLLAVDEAVAAVVRALADTGELANTLIVFTSDNGLFHGEHRVAYGKIMLYEPSARVPLIVRGPGFPAGLRVRQPVANVDLAPTIVQAAGAVAGREPDGRSLRALAEAPATGDGRALLLEAKLGGYVAVRTARWLYAESTNGERELYDLVADPYELRSLHADPALAQLRARLASRLSGLKACKGSSCRG